jgi:hypothetical protein
MARAIGTKKDGQGHRLGSPSKRSAAEAAGTDIEAIRQGMGHSKSDTTKIYARAGVKATDNVAQLRVKSRAGNGMKTGS